MFTDTDSLVHETKRKDDYKDFYENKSLFHFSDYPLHSKFFGPVNKEVISKMEDKFKSKIIREFIGLKSKIYSIIAADNEEVKKAKRVNKNVLKNKT